MKGVVEGLIGALHIDNFSVEAAAHPTFRPGRTARLLLGEKQLGLMGEIHPLVVEAFDVRNGYPVLGLELDLELLLAAIPPWHHIEPVTNYPAILEDVALVVDRLTTAAQVEEQIRLAGGYLLKAVELFDVYEGQQVGAGKKSLAYHLTFQSPNKTLTDKDVKKQRQRIVQQLERNLGARLRD